MGITSMRFVRILAALTLVVGWAQGALAADTYAAIALSKASGAYGYGNGFGSRDEAEERALQECGAGCTIVLWVKNQCAGLAVGRGHGYGTYMGANERIVGDGSLNACEGYTSDCEVKVTVCSAN